MAFCSHWYAWIRSSSAAGLYPLAYARNVACQTCRFQRAAPKYPKSTKKRRRLPKNPLLNLDCTCPLLSLKAGAEETNCQSSHIFDSLYALHFMNLALIKALKPKHKEECLGCGGDWWLEGPRVRLATLLHCLV